MIEVYVIESLTDATWYTGIALNAVKRLKEHNHGKNRFTSGRVPRLHDAVDQALFIRHERPDIIMDLFSI